MGDPEEPGPPDEPDDAPPEGDDEDDITIPGLREVTSFDVGGHQHYVSVPGDREGPSLVSATSIPAIVLPEEPDADISTSPTHRAITAFDLGASDHALKMPAAKPAPWSSQTLPIAAQLERAGVTGQTGENALPEEELAETEEGDEEPELVKPVYLDQSTPDEREEQAISRRRFVARGAAILVAAGFGIQAWGRRPMPGGDLGYKPAVFEEADFRTMHRAFEALLGDQEAAGQAASQADLHFARSTASARKQLRSDLALLELGPRHVFDGRRFSRLDPERARAVLEGWRTSSLSSRRRLHADLSRLARYCWATHPARATEAGG